MQTIQKDNVTDLVSDLTDGDGQSSGQDQSSSDSQQSDSNAPQDLNDNQGVGNDGQIIDLGITGNTINKQ